MTDLRVTHTLLIPEEELEWSFSPSPGPGGQHANKTSTRAELAWNLERSRVLSYAQRERIRRELHNRIDARGTLRIASSTHRSQLRNREEATRRLAELVGGALRPVKQRRSTVPRKAAQERRLRSKRLRSDVKQLRRTPGAE